MRSGSCPKCNSSKIGRFENLLDARTENREETRISNREFRRLSAFQVKTGFMSSETHEALVEALVCTECGYFEEYVKAPADVPWENMPMFSWYRPAEH